MVENQAYLFMVFTLVGMLIGFLFDIFRILRKAIQTKDFVTYLEDIAFWIITGIIIIYSMYIFCDGELRFFMVIGIFLGILIYFFTLSKYIIKISIIIINFVEKIIMIPIKITNKIIKKTLYPIIILIEKIMCDIVKKIKKFKKPFRFVKNKSFFKVFVKKNEKNRGFFKKKENIILYGRK